MIKIINLFLLLKNYLLHLLNEKGSFLAVIAHFVIRWMLSTQYGLAINAIRDDEDKQQHEDCETTPPRKEDENQNYEKVVKETYDYVPINLDYFLNCELQQGRGGKEVILNNYNLKTVKDVIAADEKELLAISGVGINLVKKLKELK